MDLPAFPRNFPDELASAAYVAGSEAAWPPENAINVVLWLRENGIAVLGTELWVVREDGIQPGIFVNGVREIHGNAILAKQNESWDGYVKRSADETLRYLRSFETSPEAKQQGKVFFNIVWADEAEYLNLSARI